MSLRLLQKVLLASLRTGEEVALDVACARGHSLVPGRGRDKMPLSCWGRERPHVGQLGGLVLVRWWQWLSQHGSRPSAVVLPAPPV